MRCSECNERNSVAAKECRSCGHKFQAKPIPKNVKVGAAVAGGLLVLSVVAASLIPILTDPDRAIGSIAKKVAHGSSDPNEAKKANNELDEALKNYLKRHGALPSPRLTQKMQDALGDSAFEVHIFDLPRGLSVIEVDSMLQTNDYLLLKNGSTVKVTSLPGMEVFDAAKIITDSAAPVLILLGHTGGQAVHKPLVRSYALLPDDTVDQTTKTVPELKADGVAVFGANGKDINIDYAFYSLGAGEKLFDANAALPPGLSDDHVHGILRWHNGKYDLQPNSNRSQLSALYALAKCIVTPKQAGHYTDTLGQNGVAFINARKDAMTTPPEFKIFRAANSAAAAPESAPQAPESKHHKHKHSTPPPTVVVAQNEYLLVSKIENFTAQLTRDSAGDWHVGAVKSTPAAEIAAQITPPTPAPITTTTGAPITEVASTTSTTSTATTTSTTTTTSGATADTSGVMSEKDIKESKEKLKQVLDSAKDIKADKEKIAMTQPASGTESGDSDKDKASKDKSKDDGGNEQSSPSEDKQTGVAATVHNQIDASQVRVRSGPGPNFKPLTTIARGAKLTIIGKSNGWYKIKANGQTGFIYGGLIDYKTPDAYETITVHKNEGLTDDKGKSVGASKPGDRLVVLGTEKNGKLKVQLSGGQTAYINKNATESQDTPQFVP